ncbi:MAG: hypothetical protein V7696_00400 [Halioglobus sp.]
MSAFAFDTLKFVRRLTDAGIPQLQAEAQAEVMAEAFVFNMDQLVTRDYLDARLDARFAQQDARLDVRFAEQDARIDSGFAEQKVLIDSGFAKQKVLIDSGFAEHKALMNSGLAKQDARIDSRFVAQDSDLRARFAQIDKQLFLHTWILAAIAATTVIPVLTKLFNP